MDEYWTPEQKAEWTSRWNASTEDSPERLILDDMRWTGLFQSAQSPLPSQVMQAPAAPTLPPVYPVPVAEKEKEELIRKKEMAEFYKGRRMSNAEISAFSDSLPSPPVAVPPGGIGFGKTRRQVFGRGRPPRPEPGPSRPLRLMISDLEAMIARNPKVSQRYNFPASLEQLKGKQSRAELGIANTQTRRNVRLHGGRTLKSKKGGQIITIFFNIRDQVKMYHWQTKSFSEHKATDDLVGKLDTNIDTFVEVYMGRYGRPVIKKTLPVKNLTVTGIRAFIARSSKWLETSLPRMLKKTDSDLLNVRDEILADLNQIKYLFTLS